MSHFKESVHGAPRQNKRVFSRLEKKLRYSVLPRPHCALWRGYFFSRFTQRVDRVWKISGNLDYHVYNNSASNKIPDNFLQTNALQIIKQAAESEHSEASKIHSQKHDGHHSIRDMNTE